jgi:hypothetical protein
MPRRFLVAGIDYGTSFTKIVVRDNSPGNEAKVVVTQYCQKGLFPSVIGIEKGSLIFPPVPTQAKQLLFLKMLSGDLANGVAIKNSPIILPASVYEIAETISDDHAFIRSLLAFYFANLMRQVETFIKHDTRWNDHDFDRKIHDDHLIYQLAVPSGLINKSGAVEFLFRESLLCAYMLKNNPLLSSPRGTNWRDWHELVLSAANRNLVGEKMFEWQCLVYPETAGATQAYFRSPNASEGLFVTMDVGAGTVDLNAFRRQSKVKDCSYYSTLVCPLGLQNLRSPISKGVPVEEAEFMEELRSKVQAINLLARKYQPNIGTQGNKTWDRATFFIFGGGANHHSYSANFQHGLIQSAIRQPAIQRLPDASDLRLPKDTDFGRFAVAYGLSFFKANLDRVKLPHELKTFNELYPPDEKDKPPPYGFTWED